MVHSIHKGNLICCDYILSTSRKAIIYIVFCQPWLSEYIYGSSDSLCIKTFYRHEFFPNVKTTLINASKQIPLPTRDHVCAHKKWFLINLVEAFSILQNANLEFWIQWLNWLFIWFWCFVICEYFSFCLLFFSCKISIKIIWGQIPTAVSSTMFRRACATCSGRCVTFQLNRKTQVSGDQAINQNNFSQYKKSLKF